MPVYMNYQQITPTPFVPVIPPRFFPQVGRVAHVDMPVAVAVKAQGAAVLGTLQGALQPTTQDVLSAIQQLTKIVCQIGNNQLIIEQMLYDVQRSLVPTATNVISVGNVLSGLTSTLSAMTAR